MGQVCPGEPLFRLGVARLYAHRHGPGPLPSESPELASILGEPHNVRGPWQGPFRVGWTDLVLARHAQTATGGVDGLALTHLDAFERMPQGGTPWKLAESYEDGVGVGAPTTHETADLDARAASTARLMSARPRLVRARAAEVVEALGTAYRAPVLLRSSGPTYLHVAE
jgi:adenylosuccinate synthase